MIFPCSRHPPRTPARRCSTVAVGLSAQPTCRRSPSNSRRPRARRPRLPVAFQLARRLRKAPRAIAQELAAGTLGRSRASSRVESTPNGYLNRAILDRAAFLHRAHRPARGRSDPGGPRARPSSSTRRSTRTRRRTSATCATPRSATRSSACCGSAARRSKCRTTSTTPASRSPTSSSASASSSSKTLDDVRRDRRHHALRLLLLGPLRARHRVVRRRQGAARRSAPRRCTTSSTAATTPPRWAPSSSTASCART